MNPDALGFTAFTTIIPFLFGGSVGAIVQAGAEIVGRTEARMRNWTHPVNFVSIAANIVSSPALVAAAVGLSAFSEASPTLKLVQTTALTLGSACAGVLAGRILTDRLIAIERQVT